MIITKQATPYATAWRVTRDGKILTDVVAWLSSTNAPRATEYGQSWVWVEALYVEHARLIADMYFRSDMRCAPGQVIAAGLTDTQRAALERAGGDIARDWIAQTGAAATDYDFAQPGDWQHCRDVARRNGIDWSGAQPTRLLLIEVWAAIERGYLAVALAQ